MNYWEASAASGEDMKQMRRKMIARDAFSASPVRASRSADKAAGTFRSAEPALSPLVASTATLVRGSTAWR